MKIRRGYVSNSSTSSFILAVRGDVATKERLLELFDVPEDSFLYWFAVEIAEFLADHGQMERYTCYEDLRKRNSWPRDEDEFKAEWARWLQLLEEGWTVYEGFTSNEGYGIQVWLVNQDINFESDDLILEKEGGY